MQCAPMSKRRPLLRLFPVLVLNVIELGIALPVLPAIALALGGSALDVGLLYTLQSLGQFVMAPAWGALSDRFGRKPVLIGTFVLAAAAEIATAFASTLVALYLARLFVGLCAGNIATASALIADITDEEDRSKGMAVVGISFGLGFTIGPAIGAAVSYFAADGIGAFAVGAPFLAAGILSLFTAAIGTFLIWEPALSAEEREARRSHRPSLRTIIDLTSRTELRQMFTLFLLYTVAASIMEGTFFLFMEAEYAYGEEQVGIIFAALGLLMAFTQGSVGPVSRWMGDQNMTIVGGIAVGSGLMAAAFVDPIAGFLVLIGLSTIGRAYIHPGILSITSKSGREPGETGTIMGVLQSSSSLGRIVGPALGGALFEYVSHSSPFVAAGAIMLVSIALWALSRRKFQVS